MGVVDVGMVVVVVVGMGFEAGTGVGAVRACMSSRMLSLLRWLSVA